MLRESEYMIALNDTRVQHGRVTLNIQEYWLLGGI